MNEQGSAWDPIHEQRFAWDPKAGAYVPTDTMTNNIERPVRPTISRSKFLKGPVPWAWLITASQLKGRALEVGLCLWRLKGATHKDSILLSNSELEPFGIDRAAKSRALSALEKAGLIAVARTRGRWPTVTVLEL
jgi:DNA-binding transcriptional ArsR family regulator